MHEVVASDRFRTPDRRAPPTLTVALTSGKNSLMKAIKVTSKGQITIPIEIRTALGIDDQSYLEVSERDQEIRLRKLVTARPLGDDDPIWSLVGAGESGRGDVSAHHDRHLAADEIARWRGSS